MPEDRLTAGDIAPQFQAIDVHGNTVALRDHTDKYTLVVFLRYAACPWCNLTIHRLALEQTRLKKAGCEIIAFIQSNPDAITENIYNRHEHTPAFPIVADVERTFYKKYFVRDAKSAATVVKSITDIPFWVRSITKGFTQKSVDGDLFLVPASFLISPGAQKIISAHYSSSFYDHLVFEEIYNHLYAPATH